MSALCQKRTFSLQKNVVIRSPRRRPAEGAGARRGPKPEIDDKLIFSWRLHRHVGRLLPLEDAVDVAGRAPIHVDPIRPIGKKATSDDKEAFEVDRGKLVPCRKANDQIAMNEGRPARG